MRLIAVACELWASIQALARFQAECDMGASTKGEGWAIKVQFRAEVAVDVNEDCEHTISKMQALSSTLRRSRRLG